ncbi:MAG: hypothetical protein EXS17_07415 [Phycisphaerales bacterium]|nr:hypothetical protein [Phycisphaerales bacterium]
MLSWPDELTTELRHDLFGWCELWSVPTLADEVTVAVSRRLTSSLGRANYRHQRVTLQHTLLHPMAAALLREVLCHELAHLAAYRLHGTKIRPHGREWKALLIAAQYPPNVTYAAESLPACFAVHKRFRRPPARRSSWARLTQWIAGIPCAVR